jgi:DNA-3-methyladenine glycosylase I
MITRRIPDHPPQRCPWCEGDDTYVRYHDEVWGVPVHDDQRLFEFLVLETAQAGLSWITILKRQEGYRQAFANYQIEQVAEYSTAKVQQLLQNTGIIRNRKKIEATVNNARRFIEVQKERGTFSNYYWQFTNGLPIQNTWATLAEVPAQTPLSGQISKDLRKRGFQFVGPTVMYAFMQATGMVNDHLTNCFRYSEIQKMTPHSQR